jgi:autotransporter-associated beta strand protein
MSLRLKLSLLALALASAATTSRGQTVTWIGGFPDDQFTTATNWVGGGAPANNGNETLQFTSNSDSLLNLDVNAFFNGVMVQAFSFDFTEVDITGGNSLSIGNGGIYVQANNSQTSFLTVDTSVILLANQTWGIGSNPGGMLTVNGIVSGNFGLTLDGDDNRATFTLGSGASTFTGGVYVTGDNSVLVAGTSSSGGSPGAPTAGPVGTGTLLLGDGTALATPNSTPVTLDNTLTLGDQTDGSSITLGQAFQNFETKLTLTGPVLLNDPDLEIDISSDSIVTFSGDMTGFNPAVCLDIGTTGFQNSIAILQGNISNVARFDIEDNASVILDAPAGNLPSGTTQIGGVSDIGALSASDYVGLGRAYALPGYVTQFMGFLHSTGSDVNFAGSLGFDAVTGGAATFNDPVDLTNFTAPGFIGLGSATSAILGAAAVITPPGGTSGTAYHFGGGGGTLTVLSPLGDGTGGPRSLTMIGGNGIAALTLVLGGAGGSLTYTGGTSVYDEALIFDSTLPATGSLTIGAGPSLPGYIGSTVNSGYSDANSNIGTFVNRFGTTSQGVIGFDIIGGGVRTVTSDIDLSNAGAGAYLGTATAVNFSGTTLTPFNNQYQFAGVKGGQVEVSSNLFIPSASVVIGLEDTIESYNMALGFTSISSVTLSGSNSYTGGTTLNSGYLFVTNQNSIGYGPLTVPDSSDFLRSGWVATLSTSGGPVSLGNDISVPNAGLALNFDNGGLLTLTGTISGGQIGIYGPVTLTGNNTYAGGTTVAAVPVTIASDTGFGTGGVNATGSSLFFTSANPVLASDLVSQVIFTDTAATFTGNATINNLSMAEGSLINFNGATAEIDGFGGDSLNSGNVISLGTNTVLTINTDNGGNGGSDYHGIITGATASLVVTGSGGSLNLSGANTYGNGTTLNGGNALILSNNAALGTGPVTVNSGALVTNTGITIANPITLNGSGGGEAGLAGYGTFSPGGNLAFQNFAGVDPGRGLIGGGNGNNTLPIPGALSFGAGTSITFGPSGGYIFSMTDANGVAGTGYGTVNVGGSLTLAGGPFVLSLFTYDPSSNTPGNALNFNPNNFYTWTLVSASSISGFNAGFFNPLNGGTFSVSKTGNDLDLNFTPVPEPSTWAMMAAGLFAMGGAALRRRRR